MGLPIVLVGFFPQGLPGVMQSSPVAVTPECKQRPVAFTALGLKYTVVN